MLLGPYCFSRGELECEFEMTGTQRGNAFVGQVLTAIILREEVLLEEKNSGNKWSSYTPILLADTTGILRRVARTRTGPLRQRDARKTAASAGRAG